MVFTSPHLCFYFSHGFEANDKLMSLGNGRVSRVEGHRSRVEGHRSRVESRGSKVEVEGRKSKILNFLSILKVLQPLNAAKQLVSLSKLKYFANV